jgi:hypothetical protein
MVGMAARKDRATAILDPGYPVANSEAVQGAAPVSDVEQVRKDVADGKLGLLSILQDMHVAHMTPQPTGTKDPLRIRRWRQLFSRKPEKFLAILDSYERKVAARRQGAKEHDAEFERLRVAEAKLKGDLTAARSRVAELEEQLSAAGGDEYEDPAVERLRELRVTLAKEGGSN